MSEAALAPATADSQRLPPARPRRNWLNPLEALERGFALFQATFSQEAWRYYAGAAPLVVCFIPIWVIDGQIRVSDGWLMLEAAVLASAYLLRACTTASYMQRVRERAFGVPRTKALGAGARLAAIGRLLAWKIVLSVAVLVTLPTFAGAAWFYGASQFAGLEAQEDASDRHSFRGCLALSGKWFAGALLLFLMLFPLWGAVWLNGLILAILVPELLHAIFGVNTLLSTQMGDYALIRSSAFWLSLFAGAWVALDPIVKCTFVVVYQYLRSRREGDDLRGLLASLPREQQKKAEMIGTTGAGRGARVGSMVVLAVMLLGAARTANGRSTQTMAAPSSAETAVDSAQAARVQQLRQALHEESQREIYRWHDAEHPSPPTWLDRLLEKIGHAIERGWDALVNFLRRLWPSGLSLSPGAGKHAWRLKDLRLWLALITALTLMTGAFFFWRRRRRDPAQLTIPIAMAPFSDLSEAVASERSEDEWFALANRLEGEGDLRLALRAAYLGLLAGLAQREWLTIRRDRTNREYLDEFTRRWRRRSQAAVEARGEIPEKLRGSLRQFDRVWYGSYSPTPTAVTAYRQGLRELLSHV
ncbi:MAG TPA: DUF4129 domain-containing protein [Candidatus Dormibacteraeota bacterium]|nr:DUF4129 domain-containing protein [Candidatus Dormibacteraeota bacterium]